MTVPAPTGEYTLSLKDNVLCDSDKVALSLEYTVTDSDGSTAPGTLAITVADAGDPCLEEGSRCGAQTRREMVVWASGS